MYNEKINWYKYCISCYNHKGARVKNRAYKYLQLRCTGTYKRKRVELALPTIISKLEGRGYELYPVEKSPISETTYIYIKKPDHPFKNYIKIRVSCHALKKNNADINIYV